MTTKLHDYDVAKHLRTPEEGDIARAKGMAELSRNTGLGRESLYKALSADGNPQLSTVLKVAKALGLQLHVKPAA